MTATTTLECPKCYSTMRRVERGGVVVDRCTNCGGIFLDRGELEHLVSAENEYLTRSASRGYRDDDDDDDYRERGRGRDYDDDDRRYDPRTGKKKKRRGFLEDLFDFG